MKIAINRKFLKILIFLILLYQHLYAEAYGKIPFLLILLYSILDVTLFFYCYPKMRHVKIFSSCSYLLILMAYSTIFGFFVTEHRNSFLGYILYSIEYVILLLAVYIVVNGDKKADFFIFTMYSISIIGIIIALVRQQYRYNRLVISADGNANSLGNLCIICLCTCLYISLTRKKGWIILLLSTPIIFYTVILTASKKSLIILLLLIVLFVSFRFKGWLLKHYQRVFIISFILAILLYGYRSIIINAWESTTMYSRIQKISDIDIGRISLYQEAFVVFKKNPIFGVGYQCFQFYSSTGLYSHSAYAEVLAGTGIIGSLIWAAYYISIICKSIHSLFINIKKNNRLLLIIWCFIWIVCQMILDTTSTSLYSPINMALFGVVLAIIETNDIIITEGAL